MTLVVLASKIKVLKFSGRITYPTGQILTFSVALANLYLPHPFLDLEGDCVRWSHLSSWLGVLIASEGIPSGPYPLCAGFWQLTFAAAATIPFMDMRAFFLDDYVPSAQRTMVQRLIDSRQILLWYCSVVSGFLYVIPENGRDGSW